MTGHLADSRWLLKRIFRHCLRVRQRASRASTSGDSRLRTVNNFILALATVAGSVHHTLSLVFVSAANHGHHGLFSSHVLFPPQGKIKQVPRSRPVAPLEQLNNSRVVQEVCLFTEVAQFHAGELPQTVKEPLVDGNAESLLLAVDELVRNQSSHSLFENVL